MIREKPRNCISRKCAFERARYGMWVGFHFLGAYPLFELLANQRLTSSAEQGTSQAAMLMITKHMLMIGGTSIGYAVYYIVTIRAAKDTIRCGIRLLRAGCGLTMSASATGRCSGEAGQAAARRFALPFFRGQGFALRCALRCLILEFVC
jgi:hypothetical protein